MQSTTTTSNNKRTGATVGNSWAQLAKKAMTPQDKSVSDALEAKIKSDAVEKKRKERETYLERKRKEHEAYLERKARRERIANEKKEREDKDYALYKQHMFYEYGHGWFHRFDDRGDRSGEIPEPFYERVQEEIREEERLDWEMEMREIQEEQQEKEKEKKKQMERQNLKAEKKATLSPEEYRDWKKKLRQDEYEKFNDEVDEYLDRGFCEYSRQEWYGRLNKEAGKSWLDEQLLHGNIVMTKDGKYKYYSDLSFNY